MALMRILERRLRLDEGLSEDMRFFSWHCMPPGSRETIYYELKVGRCPLVKTGKRKGRPNWRKLSDVRTFNITVDKAERWEDEYEHETGKCRECMGEGKVVARISVRDGTSFRDCTKCGATGTAKVVAQ